MTFLTFIKSLFKKDNVKYLIAALITVLIVILAFTIARVRTLKTELAQSTMQNTIYQRNIEVLKDSAIHWKTKDSINATTVGLLSASSEMLKGQYSDLNNRFVNLIKDYNKKVQKQTYLEAKISAQDSIIASITSHNPDSTGSYVANDSTLHINKTVKYDDRNYNSISGDIKLHLDTNKIKSADVNLQHKFGIGIDLATYRDANGVPRVSVGTKYPNIDISVTGIQNVDDQLKAAADKAKAKSSFGIGLSVGYGYIIGSNTTLQRGAFVGIGLTYQPKFLQFNKK